MRMFVYERMLYEWLLWMIASIHILLVIKLCKILPFEETWILSPIDGTLGRKYTRLISNNSSLKKKRGLRLLCQLSLLLQSCPHRSESIFGLQTLGGWYLKQKQFKMKIVSPSQNPHQLIKIVEVARDRTLLVSFSPSDNLAYLPLC